MNVALELIGEGYRLAKEISDDTSGMRSSPRC